MAPPTDIVTTTEPGGPVPSLRVFTTSFARRSLADLVARHVVRLGGIAVITSILAILVVIVGEVVPLFRPAAVHPIDAFAVRLDAPPLAVEVDEYVAVVAILNESGFRFFSLDGVPLASPSELPGLGAAKVTSVSQSGRRHVALGLSDGRVLPVEIRFQTSFDPSGRRVEAEARPLEPVSVGPEGQALGLVAHTATDTGAAIAAATGSKQIAIVRVSEESSLLGETSRKAERSVLDLSTAGEISALAVDGRGDDLFVGTGAGEVLRIDLRTAEPRVSSPRSLAPSGTPITLLGFVLGDRTLVVGDAAGAVSSWQLLPGSDGESELVKVHAFRRHPAGVSKFSPSRRHKGFWTGDAAGELRFHYATTGQTLLAFDAGE
ncbi:MAG: ABC transporter permease subunit, partial [Candidatus Binatia bacterium]